MLFLSNITVIIILAKCAFAVFPLCYPALVPSQKQFEYSFEQTSWIFLQQKYFLIFFYVRLQDLIYVLNLQSKIHFRRRLPREGEVSDPGVGAGVGPAGLEESLAWGCDDGQLLSWTWAASLGVC